MEKITVAVKNRYRRLSKTTRGALIVLLIVVPDWASREGFWYRFAAAAWPLLKRAYASSYGKLTLVVLAFLLIWLDQRRITRKRSASHDGDTLKGRTLKLHDEIQSFLDGLGPMPQDEMMGISQVRAGPDWRSADGIMHDSAIVRATGRLSQRMAKVDYGYELHFAAPLLRIYNEFGFRGVIDQQMKDLIFKKEPYNREVALRDIVQALSRLAELEEAAYPD